LFSEDYPNLEIEPIQTVATLDIGPTLLSRIGRKLLNLKSNATCIVNSKRGHIHFASGNIQAPLEQFQSDLEMLLEGAGAKLGAVVESYKFHTPNTGDITTPYHLKVTLAPGC
jgi:hypothetical protein